MNKIYNEEIKNKFLATYDNTGTQSTLRHVFYKSYLIEDTLGIDLYNFNLDQIGKVIANCSPHNNQTSRSISRYISSFIDWATEEGLRESNLNPTKGADPSFYDQFVDKKKVHFSHEEFFQLLSQMQNAQDAAFLALLYNGLMGRSFSQLRELKKSDILWDSNEVFVKERNMNIKVDADTMKYVEKAINQTTYFTYNKETQEHNEKQLMDSDYLFRNVQSPRTTIGISVNPSVFYTRLNNLKEEFELEYLTPNAIKQSGMIKKAADLFEEYGKLDYEQFAIIGDKYDYATVKSPAGEYFNTTLMREFISESNLKEFYNIEIKF